MPAMATGVTLVFRVTTVLNHGWALPLFKACSSALLILDALDEELVGGDVAIGGLLFPQHALRN